MPQLPCKLKSVLHLSAYNYICVALHAFTVLTSHTHTETRHRWLDVDAELCVIVRSNRSIPGWSLEERLGLSKQHRAVLAATGTDGTAHPRLRDQIL